MRDTFLKVGQSLIVKKQLGTEKDLKEQMIHSVMPLKVADWLMTGHAEDQDDDQSGLPTSKNQSEDANTKNGALDYDDDSLTDSDFQVGFPIPISNSGIPKLSFNTDSEIQN